MRKRLAEWYDLSNGTSICIHNPVRTAFLVILVMEKERIPLRDVDEVFQAVEDILCFQEVTHTKRNEKNPNFPK